MQINLLSCKFMGPAGYGSTSDAVQCIDYCLAQKAHVISASWTTGTLPNPPLEDAGGCAAGGPSPAYGRAAPGSFTMRLHTSVHPGILQRPACFAHVCHVLLVGWS